MQAKPQPLSQVILVLASLALCPSGAWGASGNTCPDDLCDSKAGNTCLDNPVADLCYLTTKTGAPGVLTCKEEPGLDLCDLGPAKTTTSALPMSVTSTFLPMVVTAETRLRLSSIPSNFTTDPMVKVSLQEAIADTIPGIEKEHVTIISIAIASSRRLDMIGSIPRKLSDDVTVRYTIRPPPTYTGGAITANSIDTAALKTNINNNFRSNGIVAEVTSVDLKIVASMSGSTPVTTTAKENEPISGAVRSQTTAILALLFAGALGRGDAGAILLLPLALIPLIAVAAGALPVGWLD